MVTWGSLVVFFIFHLVLYLPAIGYSYSGTFTRVASTVSYWSVILLSTAILILPVMCYRVYQSLVSTSLVHRIRELRQKSKSLVFPSEKQQDIPIAKSEELKTSSEQHRNSVEAETSKAVTFSRTSLRSSIRSRSSYAFSQEEGLGRLLTSGRVFKRKNQSNPPISGWWIQIILRLINHRTISMHFTKLLFFFRMYFLFFNVKIYFKFNKIYFMFILHLNTSEAINSLKQTSC